MATELYNNYLIASIPRYSDENNAWSVKLIISRREGYYLHYHSFEHPKLFDTLPEAVTEGLLIARLWIDKKL
ncbi:MAG: hypothetical protein ACREQ7_11815 [Candidatus Binatia bacterium]